MRPGNATNNIRQRGPCPRWPPYLNLSQMGQLGQLAGSRAHRSFGPGFFCSCTSTRASVSGRPPSSGVFPPRSFWTSAVKPRSGLQPVKQSRAKTAAHPVGNQTPLRNATWPDKVPYLTRDTNEILFEVHAAAVLDDLATLSNGSPKSSPGIEVLVSCLPAVYFALTLRRQ